MSAQKFFTVKGRTFMEVTPADSLTRSTMVKDVLKRGDKFVVDMNTGKLTILSSKGVDIEDLPYTITFPNQPHLPSKAVKSLSQLMFHIGNYRNTWHEYDMSILVSHKGRSVSIKLNQNVELDDAIILAGKAYKDLKGE